MEIRDEKVPAFLEAAKDRLLHSGRFTAIGFSCNFFQTLSSFALIRRIKQLHPQIKVVCGGASFHDVMGMELMDKFDLIDAVCLGEADEVVVPLFQALATHREPKGLQGVIYRDHMGRARRGPVYSATPAKVLHENPHPDFEEYFTDLESAGLDPGRTFPLVIETSRGCWKGAKQHCVFCGLQEQNIAFRRMSAARAMACFDHLSRTYPTKRFMIVDRILPRAYFRDLLPMLRDAPFSRAWNCGLNSGASSTEARSSFWPTPG